MPLRVLRFLELMLIACLSLLYVEAAQAEPRTLTVRKHGDGFTRMDLQVGGLKSSGGSTVLFLNTLKRDLKASGWFNVVNTGSRDVTVDGSVSESGGYLTVKCSVMNLSSRKVYMSKTFNDRSSSYIDLAHKVADEIVFAVKKVQGIASSRIVMVRSVDGKKDLYICGYDGQKLIQVTRDASVCLSPSWGPDAKSLVYTSFHKGFPDVYKVDLRTNRRTRVSGYAGLNAGADISPDGSRMVLTLSKDGNPDLYVKNLRSGQLKRLTRTRNASEASPSWSPDGKQIVFVSDQSGKPHLYTMASTGGTPRLLTIQGNENVSPDWGTNGLIVYSSRRGGRYQVCVIDPSKRKGFQVTTEYVDHEDPSWGPDGRHIVCTKTVSYHSDLYILDTLGDPPVRLTRLKGDWYSAAWSPR